MQLTGVYAWHFLFFFPPCERGGYRIKWGQLRVKESFDDQPASTGTEPEL